MVVKRRGIVVSSLHTHSESYPAFIYSHPPSPTYTPFPSPPTGVHKSVVCAKNGKVKDKDKTWEATKKALLSDVKAFMDALLDFKAQVDKGAVPESNWADVREYLALPYFNVEAIKVRRRRRDRGGSHRILTGRVLYIFRCICEQ